MNRGLSRDTRFVFVLDLDETLVHYKKDFEFRLDTKLERLPYIVLRPNLKKFLKKLARQGDIVLFSLGNKSYVRHVLKWHLPHLRKLFRYTFTYKDALLSMKLFGKYKHSKFVYKSSNFSRKRRLIGIDDLARKNMDKKGYFKVFTVKPFEGDMLDNCLLKVTRKIDKLIN